MKKTSGPQGGFLGRFFLFRFYSWPRPTPSTNSHINLGRIFLPQSANVLIVYCNLPFNFRQGNNSVRAAVISIDAHGLLRIYVFLLFYYRCIIISVSRRILMAYVTTVSAWWLNLDLRRFGHETRYTILLNRLLGRRVAVGNQLYYAEMV